MNVKPMAAPTQSHPGQSQQAQDSKQRAINAFMASNQPQQSQVQNQSSVSPEELSAIVPKAIEEEIKETIVEEVKPVEKVEDPALSRQFAQLARQERALRAKAQQQELAMKAREDAIKAKEAQFLSQSDQYKNHVPRERIKQETLQVLAEAGVSYDEITNQILTQQPSDPRMEATINSLKAEIQSLKSGIDENKKSYTDQQASAYQAAVKQIASDVNTLVSSDPMFETVKATQSAQDVVDLITQTYEKDGILLSIEDAATQVEDYLIEEAMKITKIDKIKKRMAQGSATQQPTPAAETAVKSTQSQPMKTLTNASGVPRKLTSKERAILAFGGNLKS